MSQDELKEEYDKYNTEDMFNALKESVEAQVVRTEPYKGFGYNIFPYEFQMVGRVGLLRISTALRTRPTSIFTALTKPIR